MALQFITGSSGSGKSYTLYQTIIRESLAHPEVNYFIIVPEQFTMQTQRDLVTMHPRKGIMNIDVLSFGRLAYRVFDELGGDGRKILEETGKNLVLRKIAGERQKELSVFGHNLKKVGYISEIKSMISELTQYGVGLEEMQHMLDISKERPLLYEKLKDIQVIYKAFRSYLKDNYITTEEILDVLGRIIHRSNLVKDAVFALDGFTGFTPIQNQLMEKLMKQARQVVVTVTLDSQESSCQLDEEYRLFHMSKKMIAALKKTAEDCGVRVEELIRLDGPVYRFREAEALGFLERHLFRYRRAVYEKEQSALSIHAARNPMEETAFLGREIKNLVREKGYRYKDIAIITGAMESYAPHIQNQFEDLDIPCFIDYKRSILQNPFIEFIRSLLDMITHNFDYESTFRFLRSGFVNLRQEEIDELENYCLALGIRGWKKWSDRWVRKYKRLSEENLVRVNEYREQFVKQLEVFYQTVKPANQNVTVLTKALYEFVAGQDIQRKLKVYEEQFLEAGEMTLAKEYHQLYGIVMDLFDKAVDLIGEEQITLEEYKAILDAGFEEAKVGVIPPSMDQIVVGDIQRTRLKDIKVLFFAGINDGIIPNTDGGGGLISELDREYLAEHEVSLAPTARENSYIQRFYLYLNLTKPKERLYLSYSKVSESGDTLHPSYLINNIGKLFPNIERKDEDQYEQLTDWLVTQKQSIRYLVEELEAAKRGQASVYWKELYSWYKSKAEWQAQIKRLLKASYSEYVTSNLGKAAARALYGTTLQNSVSRLEQYAECAFAHFLRYGIVLQEREAYEFAAVDMGNVFHRALEIFSNKLESSGYDWFHLPDELREQMLEESVEETVTDYGNTVLHSSARNEYIISRIRRMMSRTVWALSEQIKRGTFVPSRYEVSFAMEENLDAVNISLSAEEQMKLQGRIDRVDICETEDQVYVKVIDYKSGDKNFDIVAMYHGLQLQLVVYLNAAMELAAKEYKGKEIIPAGVFYYNMKDPVIDKKSGEAAEEIQERLLKELRMKGLVNSDPEIIDKMDHFTKGASAVIPVTKSSKGGFTKASNIASHEQFKQISQFVNEKMQEIGGRIIGGEIPVNPYEWNKKKPCEYCAYDGVCGFDQKVPGFSYRRLANFDHEEVWNRVGNEEREEGQGHE